jgi:hypothetical protein
MQMKSVKVKVELGELPKALRFAVFASKVI